VLDCIDECSLISRQIFVAIVRTHELAATAAFLPADDAAGFLGKCGDSKQQDPNSC